MNNQKLAVIIEESGLEKTQGQVILDNFSKFIQEASEWETKAKAIVITDISQVKEMAEAREARLALKSIRVNAENVRKQLKEKALREGKAIDGIANVIKALIIPIEEHLEKQENFAENLEKERKARIEAERAFEMQKYVEDITLYNFKEMSEEAFDNLVGTLKLAFEASQKAIKKAERDRIDNEIKEKAEAEKNKLEVAKLKAEAELREKELAKERAEQAKKLKAEAEARGKVEMELKAKKDDEEKKKKEADDKAKADELAKLKADKEKELAPDKEKLIAYAVELGCLEVPKLQTKEGKETLEKALEILGRVVATLKSN